MSQCPFFPLYTFAKSRISCGCCRPQIMVSEIYEAWIKRRLEWMRVGRREFAWVSTQLSLLGQTRSESCMRVNESLSSFFDFLDFARCLPTSFSSFFDACQTADSPSHYSNCHLSMIRNNIFFFLWVTTWKSPASATLYDSRATLMTGQTSQTSHWLSSKFEPAQSWWECMRVDESWRSNESESCDSHPRLINP